MQAIGADARGGAPRAGVAGGDSPGPAVSTTRERVPSQATIVAVPGLGLLAARNSSLGLLTSARPRPCISKTPSSWVAPKRFLTARSSRWLAKRSPSKVSTASTRCSSTLGPASMPSLVTWPTSSRAVSWRLAMRARAAAHSRTWATEPGALPSSASCRAWMLSMIATAGRRASSSCEHQLQIGFREELETLRSAPPDPCRLARRPSPLAAGHLGQAPPAQLHLLGRFLGADVEHRAAARHRPGALQQQGGFADAGIAPQQHQRSRHQATTEHPVEFAVAAAEPLQGPLPHRMDRLRTPRSAGGGSLSIRPIPVFGHTAAAGPPPERAPAGAAVNQLPVPPVPPGCSSCRRPRNGRRTGGCGRRSCCRRSGWTGAPGPSLQLDL